MLFNKRVHIAVNTRDTSAPVEMHLFTWAPPTCRCIVVSVSPWVPSTRKIGKKEEMLKQIHPPNLLAGINKSILTAGLEQCMPDGLSCGHMLLVFLLGLLSNNNNKKKKVMNKLCIRNRHVRKDRKKAGHHHRLQVLFKARLGYPNECL